MKTTVKAWLEEGKVDVFLGYKITEGHPLPHFFSRNNLEEVEDLVTGPARYPLEKIATAAAKERPGIRIGLLARECNQRALNILYLWNQLDPDRVRTLAVNCCPSPRKAQGDCSYLVTVERGRYKRHAGIDNNMEPEALERYESGERFERWMYEFHKCIKCYGCRNICPACFCKACSLESPDLVETGDLPPEIPIFHLIRAVHMAGRCIDCGLCEDACPGDIPLRLLYRKVNEIVREVFHYDTGSSPELSPLNVLGDKVSLEPAPTRGTAPSDP